jgi:hypothetical protein
MSDKTFLEENFKALNCVCLGGQRGSGSSPWVRFWERRECKLLFNPLYEKYGRVE